MSECQLVLPFHSSVMPSFHHSIAVPLYRCRSSYP